MLKLKVMLLSKFKNRIKWSLFFTLLIFGLSKSASAYQNARVIDQDAKVYQSPDAGSNELTSVKVGQYLKISSKAVKDSDGRNWYKVFTGSTFGYMQSQQLEPSVMKRELASVGIQSFMQPASEDTPSVSWHFLIRGMLTYAPIMTQIPSWGGELELSFAPGFFREGVWHHFISIGGAYLNYIKGDPITAGSIIFRIPTLWTLKPEIRFRAGSSALNPLQIGGALSFTYPFSVYYGTHVAAFLDTGSMMVLRNSSHYFYAAAGIGLHF
jgi:hypothetical protein